RSTRSSPAAARRPEHEPHATDHQAARQLRVHVRPARAALPGLRQHPRRPPLPLPVRMPQEGQAMRVAMTFTFTDEERAAIARALHLEYADKLARSRLATRKQLRDYVFMAIGNQDIWVQDVLRRDEDPHEYGA